MTGGVFVSASSLKLLQDCPRAWGYKYLAGYKPEDVAPSLVLGRACHAALADWFARLQHGAAVASLDALVAVARASIDEVRRGPTPIAREEDEETDLLDEAGRVLRAFLATAPLRPAKILGVEMPFTVHVTKHPLTGERFTFEEAVSGVFDLVVEDELGVLVIDHKIARRRPPIDGGVDLQLALYATAAAECFPRTRPVRIAHHVLARTKVPSVTLREIPRSPNDEAEALEAVASGVALIHVAVAHPRPMRLLGRHRSWKCGSCSYRRRCGEDRS